MLKLFKNFGGVLKSYTYSEKLISVIAVAVFFAMLVKMIVFPYGLFGFGGTSIYTEGLVSKNGIQNINPLFVDYNEADREVSRLVFSGLMKYDPVKKAVVNDMAQLTINDAKTEYTFKMRDGLKWHDDAPITVDDVYFTFHDIILDPTFPNEVLKANFAGVKVTKIDGKTIKFVLDKPNVFFLTNFIIGILPKHILQSIKPTAILLDDFNKKPVGSGPYMVTDPVEVFKDGRTQITLTLNKNYYGEQSDIGFIRFIAYQSMDDLLTQVNAVNGVVKVSGNYINDFISNDRFNLLPYKLPQYTAVFLNLDSKILKNAKVGLALQKSLDKDAFIGKSLDKVRIDTPLLDLKQDELAYKLDVEAAKQSLWDGGYKYAASDVDHKGFRFDSSGNPLELRLIARAYDQGTYQYDETLKTVKFLQDSWQKIGFSIKVNFLALPSFNDKIAARDYDLLLVGQNLAYNLDTYSYWHSSQANASGQNLSNYKSFQVDSLIEGIRSVFDLEKRLVKLKELAGKLKADIPAIFLYSPIYYYATDGKVTGISTDGVVFPSDRFAGISVWKFTK